MQSAKLHCVHLRLCCVVLAISKAHSFVQFSTLVWFFFGDIIGAQLCHQARNHTNQQLFFSFCKILRKCQNSAERGKLCSLAFISVTCGKLWTLEVRKISRLCSRSNLVCLGLRSIQCSLCLLCMYHIFMTSGHHYLLQWRSHEWLIPVVGYLVYT